MTKINVWMEDYDDITNDFNKEVQYIAKTLGVGVGSVKITDHICGEYTIFVRENGKDVWWGYIDFWFYKAMDRGVHWHDIIEIDSNCDWVIESNPNVTYNER